jgi:replicative DNA helicase|tara:strand:+ start:1916 stop:3301 length:1386 start_codon:yes stop_codon:yes gene_type:complete
MEAIESTIIKNLVGDDTYVRKVIPYIKPEYFNDYSDKILFDIINNFIVTYGQTPTKEVLTIEVENRKDLNEDSYKELQVKIQNIDNTEVDSQWLLDSTEKWCKQRAVYLALLDSVKIADGQDEKRTEDAIPSILQEALAVSFDDHIGHDYIEDYEHRYEYYHRNENKLPFDLSLFNKITKGGLVNKSLNVALAGTGVGKSLFMCHMAAASLLQGKNVLYITLEMAEEKIAERIDANLLNVNIKDIEDLPEQLFESKVQRLAQKTNGKLIIKEYPTASAHSGHFQALLNDLSLKKSFKPDIIFIDYLNICASSRYKGALVNSYTYVKAIAEELRGLACEFDLPIVSATQTTRSGYGSSDVDLTDTSESFGLPATADLMFALISTEELEGINQLMVKQLKNRYNDINLFKRFVVGIDRSKMRLYDVEDSAQVDIVDSGQEQYDFEEIAKSQTPTAKFTDFKFN